MKLHSLSPFKDRSKTRVGRGGKRGTFSGRGTKGQKSRSGRKLRPADRDLIMRIPKRRGFRNKPTSPKPVTISLSELSAKASSFLKGNDKEFVIDKKTLIGFGFVSPHYSGEIKILGNGEVSQALVIKGVKVSESAKMKIEKAKGKVE
jgi:large subunit ribosomal protein L15